MTISPKEIHALWALLKKFENGSRADFEKIAILTFERLPRCSIQNLLNVGLLLEFLVKVGDNYEKTPTGKSFTNSEHWRFWRVPESQKDLYRKHGIAEYFVPKFHTKNRPIIIDLFSGAGGLGFGFEKAGFVTKIAVDNDPQACAAHEENFPHCLVLRSNIEDLARDPAQTVCAVNGLQTSEIDGIVGGPPCQGFSYIGERNASDERNLLTSRFMDIVLGIKPKFFVLENVAGLMSSGRVPSFANRIRQIAKSIGEPATQIVFALPDPDKKVAKRGRQYKKRLVSRVVKSYQSSLKLQITKNDSLDDMKALVQNSLACLKDTLISELMKSYVCDIKTSQKMLSKIVIQNLASIGISSIIEEGMNKGIVKETDAENVLKKLSIGQNVEVQRAASKLTQEYDNALPGGEFKNVKIGPILLHLIERASADYEISEPRVLNAAHYGAPQDRRRMFLVGIRKDLGKTFQFPDPIFEVPNKGNRKTKKESSNKFAPTSSEAIGDLPNVDMYKALIESDMIPVSELKLAASGYARKLRLEEIDKNDYSLPRPSWNPFTITCCKRTLHDEKVLKRLVTTNQGTQDERSHRTRLHPMKVSNTLRAGTREGKGSHTAVRPIHYKHPRVITVREGARLMGYPDWMAFHPTKWHGFRLVGNGVPSALGEAIGNQIKKILF